MTWTAKQTWWSNYTNERDTVICALSQSVWARPCPYVAACEKVLKEAGLKTVLHANGTNIEGERDKVFAAIKRCHEVVHQNGGATNFHVLPLGNTNRSNTDDGREDQECGGQINRSIAWWWQLRYNKKAGFIRLF